MVSIVIPHFNRIAFLKETLSSVFNQTYDNWEVIIVDDGSTELVYSNLQKMASDKVSVIQRNNNRQKGPSSCRNIGADLAKGQFLVFLDSDDLLKPFCLEQRVRLMTENESLGMGVFLIENFHTNPGDSRVIFNKKIGLEKSFGYFLRNDNPWQTMAPIWRKDFFIQCGMFDEELKFMEDPELHLRVLFQAFEKVGLHYLNPPDCYYRLHHMDETKKNFWFESIYYRIRFFEKLTDGLYDASFLRKHRRDIKKGVYSLIRTFLFSRFKQYPKLYYKLEKWMVSSKIFTRAEINRVNFLIRLGNSESSVAQKMKLKGISYYLIPKS